MINKTELQTLVTILYADLKKDLLPLYKLLFQTNNEKELDRAIQLEKEACSLFIEKSSNINLEGKTEEDLAQVFDMIEDSLREALTETFGSEYQEYQDAIMGAFSAFIRTFYIVRKNDIDLGF